MNPAPEKVAPATLRPQRLAVVIPLGNEEGTAGQMLDGILPQLQDGDAVYLILDTVSTDGTRAIVEAAAARDPRVRHLWAPENTCVVDAYFAGYRAAYDSGADWILEMDGGMSHLPAQIPQFLEAAGRGAAFVGGSRFMPGGAHRSPWQRVFISWAGSTLARLLLRSEMTDMTSGFELFSRPAMGRVLEQGVRSRAHFFQTEIRHMMHAFNWVEVPIIYTNDKPSVGGGSIGESLRGLWRLWREG